MAVFDTPRWKYVLTAIDGSIPQGAGEVYWPTQRTFSDPLDGVRSAAFAIPLDHPRVNFVLNNDTLCKVYRRRTSGIWDLMLVGDVVYTEEQGQGGIGNVVITIADPFWRLTRRLIGMAVNYTTHQALGFSVGTPSTPVDLTTAVSSALSQMNSDLFTGVALGATTLTSTMEAVGPMYAAFGGTVIQEICAALGGPDVWIVPQEPGGGSGALVTIGNMNIGPRGTWRHNAIFEYGTGKHNVINYNKIRNKQNVCNHAVSLPNGWPTAIDAGDQVVVYDDSTSQTNIGRFDDIASTDVVNKTLRQHLCQETVQVRKGPQNQIVFQPTVDCDIQYPTDYDVGDVVVARSYDVFTNSFRYNGSVRVYGVAIQIDDQDAETIALTLIPDQVSSGFSVGGI